MGALSGNPRRFPSLYFDDSKATVFDRGNVQILGDSGTLFHTDYNNNRVAIGIDDTVIAEEARLYIGGNYDPDQNSIRQYVWINDQITAAAGYDAYGLHVTNKFDADGGAHAMFASAYFGLGQVTLNGGSVTTSASLYLSNGGSTDVTYNFSLFVDDGQAAFIPGSAAAPSIVSDGNSSNPTFSPVMHTGVFWPDTTSVSLSASGAEAFRAGPEFLSFSDNATGKINPAASGWHEVQFISDSGRYASFNTGKSNDAAPGAGNPLFNLNVVTGSDSSATVRGGLLFEGIGADDLSVRVRAHSGSAAIDALKLDADVVSGSALPIFPTWTKGTTGDPTGTEGMWYVNTVDNVLKCYADGAWRTVASW